MRLRPLYRIRFRYTSIWESRLGRTEADEGHELEIGDGMCEGRLKGRFNVANSPRRRVDGTYIADIRGAIETDDGATVLLEAHGYGYDVDGRFRFVGSATHTSEHPDYSELNLAICALEGESPRVR
jgi:hypothetical protein